MDVGDVDGDPDVEVVVDGVVVIVVVTEDVEV